jgi:hypothetical protein
MNISQYLLSIISIILALFALEIKDNGQLQKVQQQTKVSHDILMEDAVKLLTIYNKIKGE